MKRILLVGGGYVGLYAALRLEHHLRPGEAEVTLVDPENFMVYRPLLAEVTSGTLEPRHAVVPLRAALRNTRLVTGRLTEVDTEAHEATVEVYDGERQVLPYDELVIGVGATARLLPVPGLVEHGIGVNSVAEAMYLRDHVLRQLELASTATDPRRRAKALTFVFVGGGYTGVEALAEAQDMAASVLHGYPGLGEEEPHWVLVEATDRILGTVPPSLSEYALRELRGRGVDVRLSTRLDSIADGVARLSDGAALPTETLVWVAGTRPNPIITEAGLPTDDKGRIPVDDRLRATDVDGVWSAGDCAAVPDAVAGGLCPPTAQYAVRQAQVLADNLVATLRNRPARPFRYRNRGEFVTLGRHKAVGEMLGVRVRGLFAWVARRGYYLSQIPTWNRRLRISADWLIGMPFRHDVVGLGSREQPRAAFLEAARR
ncbi:MAG TPA: NAD(P)/FAD-dependent oxidoreductase [Pseudonocardiaceae bacterium]|jgi:NADH dehydrogenase|nr:NAD(P)/FAD-dependent oxidoreductase [Pseudonocardiaceae bacterium]